MPVTLNACVFLKMAAAFCLVKKYCITEMYSRVDQLVLLTFLCYNLRSTLVFYESYLTIHFRCVPLRLRQLVSIPCFILSCSCLFCQKIVFLNHSRMFDLLFSSLFCCVSTD